MKSRTSPQRRRKLTAFLLIPFLLVMTGCMKLDMDIDIKSEDEAAMTMEIVDTMGFLEIAEDGCDEFASDVEDGTVEEITDEEGNAGCRVVGIIDTTDSPEEFSITKDGKEIVFKMGSVDAGLMDDDEIDLDDPMMEMFNPDVNIAVTFPGKVTYASEGGEIDGKTVTWTGLESLLSQLEARGEASGGFFGGGGSGDDADDGDDAATEDDSQESDQEAADGEDAENSADDEQAVTGAEDDAATGESDSGFPTWLVVLLGVLLLLVLFLIVMVARRQGKHSPDDPQHQQPPAQYAAQGQYPQQGQYPGQYPQQGQYPGQYPQQGQYPGQYPQQGQYPGQYPQQEQYPQQGQHPGQQWDQTQQWNQGNNGGQPPQQ